MYFKHVPDVPAVRLPGRASDALGEQVAVGLLLGGWLTILLLLFVGTGILAYLPCASFAELGIFILFFVELGRRRWRWQRTALDPLVGVLLALQILGTITGYTAGFGARSPYTAGPYAGGVFGPLQIFFDQLAAFAVYYLAAWRIAALGARSGDDVGSDAGRDPMIISLALSAGVVLLLCLLEWGRGFVVKPDDPRIQATFGNPNVLASYLVLMAPASFGAALAYSGNRATRVILIVLSFGLYWALWLSQSRGAWIGAALGLGFMAAAVWAGQASEPLRRERGRKALRLLACGALAALLFGAFVAPRLEARWHNHSQEERAIIWTASLAIIRAHPLLGVGVNGFAAAMADLHLKQKNNFTPSGYPLVPAVHLHAHNLFLQAAVEKGVAGALAGLWLVGAILAGCRALILGAPLTRPCLLIAAGLGAALIGLLAQCVADYTLWYAPVLILTWMTLGIFFQLRETGTVTDKPFFSWRKNGY